MTCMPSFSGARRPASRLSALNPQRQGRGERHTQRPPSTSRATPVMNLGLVGGQEQARVGDVRWAAHAAERDGRHELGAQLRRVAAHELGRVRPVSPITGQTALTRILSGASSTAIDLVMVITAPLEPLYQVRPGRGRRPAVEAMLTILPPPCWRNTGTAWMRAPVDRLDVDREHPVKGRLVDLESSAGCDG